jgi:hypothetical protein
MDLTDTEKIAKIARIVAIQTDNQNDEDGDRYLADAYLAMEAIELVISGQASGALRQYEEAGAALPGSPS